MGEEIMFGPDKVTTGQSGIPGRFRGYLKVQKVIKKRVLLVWFSTPTPLPHNVAGDTRTCVIVNIYSDIVSMTVHTEPKVLCPPTGGATIGLIYLCEAWCQLGLQTYETTV